MAITVIVYHACSKVPAPGLDLANPQKSNEVESSKDTKDKGVQAMETTTLEDKKSIPTSRNDKGVQAMETTTLEDKKSIATTPVESRLRDTIVYKSTFRFYMRSPESGDGASDSDSDEDEQTIPKGVVAKRRCLSVLFWYSLLVLVVTLDLYILLFWKIPYGRALAAEDDLQGTRSILHSHPRVSEGRFLRRQ